MPASRFPRTCASPRRRVRRLVRGMRQRAVARCGVVPACAIAGVADSVRLVLAASLPRVGIDADPPERLLFALQFASSQGRDSIMRRAIYWLVGGTFLLGLAGLLIGAGFWIGQRSFAGMEQARLTSSSHVPNPPAATFTASAPSTRPQATSTWRTTEKAPTPIEPAPAFTHPVPSPSRKPMDTHPALPMLPVPPKEIELPHAALTLDPPLKAPEPPRLSLPEPIPPPAGARLGSPKIDGKFEPFID